MKRFIKNKIALFNMDNQISDLERELYQDEVSKLDNRRFLDRMTDRYFRPKSFERSGKLYESLGVRGLKKVCDLIGKIHGKNPTYKQNYKLWDKTKEGLKKFDYQTRMNEAIHTFFGAYSATFGAGDVMDGDVGGSIFWGVLFGINVYASMLQRYNRARLYNVIDRIEEREKMPVPYK